MVLGLTEIFTVAFVPHIDAITDVKPVPPGYWLFGAGIYDLIFANSMLFTWKCYQPSSYCDWVLPLVLSLPWVAWSFLTVAMVISGGFGGALYGVMITVLIVKWLAVVFYVSTWLSQENGDEHLPLTG